MKNLNLFAIPVMWCNLFRAYEIAKLGGFKISVYSDKNEYPEAIQDLQIIQEYINDPEIFSLTGEICMEIVKPSRYIFTGARDETLQSAINRIEAAKLNKLPPPEICEASKGILNTASDRLHLSLKQVINAVNMSQVISQLDGASEIRAEHIAEAVNYCFVPSDCTILTMEG